MPDASSKPYSFAGVFSEILTRCSDLIDKEIQLAKAEITESVMAKVSGGAWLGAAAVCALIALLLLIEAIVFALVAAGLPPWGACLVMTAVLAIIAGGLFLKGRAPMAAPLVPQKTVHNVKRDIETAKEQLT